MRYGKHSTDQELRQGCLAGKRTAQQALYERYFGKLLGIPMRYTRDRKEAVNLLNQAFLQIFQSLPNYDERGSFKGWLSTLTFRSTMDHIRFEQRYKERYELDTVKTTGSVKNQGEQNLAAEDIFKHVQKLPDHLRVVFSLYVVDGYKHEEISTQLGITVTNSKWRLSKARESLRKTLGPLYNAKGKSA